MTDKLALFETGSAKWIEIVPGQPATLHSSIEKATHFEETFGKDEMAIKKVLIENNLNWLVGTLEFHVIRERKPFWRYVSKFSLPFS